MSGSPEQPTSPSSDQPGKTRTWWHPLLVRLLQHELSGAYDVREEVPVGKVPLRLDVVLIRRGQQQLPAEAARKLAALVQRLNRFTLVEFKAPSDALEQGDYDYLLGCAHLFRAQQADRIPNTDLSLILLAPTITSALRSDVHANHWTLEPEEDGIYRIVGPLFATWLIETDRRAGPGEPVLTLFSRIFLQNRQHIMNELTAAGFQGLLYYTLQQIQQFRTAGEPFMIQNKDVEVMNEVAKDLRAAVLETIPAEERLEGLSAEERLEGLSAEERLEGLLAEERLEGLSAEELLKYLSAKERLEGLSAEEVLRIVPSERRLEGLSADEIAAGLSEQQLTRLRELLEQRRPSGEPPRSGEAQ
jgi:hypothetical protein